MNINKCCCILAAGLGLRLGKYTATMNKSLLPLCGKAAISHIIEKTSGDVVIALGHDADRLREYCLAAHPDRRFTFVLVDKYYGPGSGPGYSLSQCAKHLQRPFLLTTVDCLIEEPYPDLSENWAGVSLTDHPERYCTFKVKKGHIDAMANKKPDGYEWAFIGVCGIRSYKEFWERLQPGDEQEFELVNVFCNWPIKATSLTWHDIGSQDTYIKTRTSLEGGFDFSKNNERTFCVQDRYIKVFEDTERCQSRMERCDLLQPTTPNLQFRGRYVYAYEKVPGETLYCQPRENLLIPLLDWCQKTLWIPVDNPSFPHWCLYFYRDKTLERLAKYLVQYGDRACCVNGKWCPLLNLDIDWDKLIGTCVTFHGDLQFDNIIFNGEFKLLDWRESFHGSLYGDVYYDLAKLYGGIRMPYAKIKKGLFTFTETDNVEYSLERLEDEQTLIDQFTEWVSNNGYCMKKIQLLTSLIYLNMAPLHEYPFDKLLFYHAKTLL